ncbi:hypothetical protein MJO28_004752 [Puccinia striiformis f. sp. tritici]|uniref:Uncharacterized protein n=1 Tax=Puccinia striiformis f. sp. tritici TaxID=168172 RepID=A0ACC0EKH4_9BASI|nr:hypothetical protein MJO28_004752 [Puccinia striiformis f. sp. tritici]KAI7959782.1 hypothetical protein MJO29_004850 [Puccinia striiformis f. sp. tritici]
MRSSIILVMVFSLFQNALTLAVSTHETTPGLAKRLIDNPCFSCLSLLTPPPPAPQQLQFRWLIKSEETTRDMRLRRSPI